MNRQSTLSFISNNAIIIVPLFPMVIIAMAVYIFTVDIGINYLIALSFSIIAAIATELSGIKIFYTSVSIYQSFKKIRQFDSFIIAEFVLLLIGVFVYMLALMLSAYVLHQKFTGFWALALVAAMLAIATYLVSSIGVAYERIEQVEEEDKLYERKQQEQFNNRSFELQKQELRIKEKQLTTGARIQSEQEKTKREELRKGVSDKQISIMSNDKSQQLEVPKNTSKKFKKEFAKQSRKNKLSKIEAKRKLLDVLKNNPYIGQNEAGRTIGVTQSTVSNYVRELKESNQLDKKDDKWIVYEW